MDIVPENLSQCAFNFDELNAQPVEQPVYKPTESQDTSQKRCYKCKEYKSRAPENFGPDKRSTDGFRNICKPCRRIEYKEALERNPDMEKERYKRRYVTFESVEARREYRAKHMRKYRKEKKAGGMCGQCCARPVEQGRLCDQCRKYRNTKNEEYRSKWPQYDKSERDKLRQEVLDAYGNKCKCCGETQQEFLAIDHVNNDGAEHRREIRRPIYRWLRQNGFPQDRFQILCHNCNMAKAMYGMCPHQVKSS